MSTHITRQWTNLILAAVIAFVLAGCAVYNRTYQTTGAAQATCGSWNIRIETNYVNGTVVGLNASISEAAGRLAFVDELFQVDSLVVTTDHPDERWVVAPSRAAYDWSQAKNPVDAGGFTIEMIDSVRCLVRLYSEHIYETPDPLRKSRRGYRLLKLEPASLQSGVLEMRQLSANVGPINDLSPITVEALQKRWPQLSPTFSLVFPPYGKAGQRHDRRLAIHVRAVDRRSAEVLCEKVLIFTQDSVGKWAFSAGV